MHQPIPELLLEIIQDGAKGERKKKPDCYQRLSNLHDFSSIRPRRVEKTTNGATFKGVVSFFFLSSPGSSSPFHLI